MNWVLFRVDRSSSVIGPSCVSTHTSLASPTAVIILLYVNNDHASDIIELSDFRRDTLRLSICTVNSIIKTNILFSSSNNQSYESQISISPILWCCKVFLIFFV